MTVIEILNQYGFATLAAIAMGWFIFFIYTYITQEVTKKLSDASGALIQLIDKIRRLDNDIIRQSFLTFSGLPHRLEKFLKIQGVNYINDSKATNAEATINALEKYRNIYWIAGGIGKTDGVKATLKHLKNVNKCYLIGKSKKDFFETLNSKIDCTISDNLSQALKEIFKETLNKSNEITVLLSPAASSFDQFLNFETRGNAFKSLISEIWEL